MEKTRLPPRYRSHDYLILAYYLLTTVDGAVGFLPDQASPGIVHIIGDDGATWTFSFSLLVFGIICLGARAINGRRLEFAGLVGLIITTVVHGAALISFGGVQSGIRIFAGALMMAVYAVLRRGRADDAFWQAYDLVKTQRGRRR